MSHANPSDRIAGGAMIATALLVVLAMAHHPSGAHGAGGLAGLVHGAMIVLLAVLTFAFTHFARRLGLDGWAVLAGLVAYAISLAAHIGAATVNGFVVPSLAARGVDNHDIFLLAWETNQALAKLGVYATGAAYALWGVELLRRGGLARWLGLAGVAAGIVPAVLLATGAIRMDVAGAFLVYAVHVGWAALVGAWLLAGKQNGERPVEESSTSADGR